MVRFSLRQCAYFRAVAEHGGIAQAARMLNLTQPSVAEGIRKLEESTGLRLFDRVHARGTTLTLQGRAFLEHVISLEDHAGQVQREADSLASRTAGHIRLGCFHTLAPFFSPGLVRSHAADFPGVSVSARELSLSALAAGLREGDLDLALTYDQGSDLDGFVVRRLVGLTPKVVVGSGHRLAGQGAVRLQDLVGEPYVMFDGPGSRDYFEALLRSHDLAPFTAYASTSLEAVRTAVGQGFGFTLLVMNPGTTTYDGRQVSVLSIQDDVRPLWIVLAYRTPPRAEPLLEDFSASAVRYFRSLFPDAASC